MHDLRHPWALAGLLIIAVTLGGGCASSAERTPAASPSDAMAVFKPTEADIDSRERALDDLARHNGIDAPPEVEVVRWIPQRELAVTMAHCLKAEGWDVQNISDAGYDMSYPEEQASAVARSEYICTARYPIPAGDPGGPSESHIRAVYDFYTAELAACIAAEGYDVTAAPTWETFLSTYNSTTEGPWTPFDGLRGPDGLSGDDLRALEAACPETLPAGAP